MKQTMEELRGRLDCVDSQLIKLLMQRMEISEQIADCKKDCDMPVLVPEREQTVLSSIVQQAGEERKEHIQLVYRAIFSASRMVQKEKGCGRYEWVGCSSSYGEILQFIYQQLGGCRYRCIKLSSEQIKEHLLRGEFDGLNVDRDDGQLVMPLCQSCTDQAIRTGYINTVLRQVDGTLLGHNTECDGFRTLFLSLCREPEKATVLVLGDGPLSRAVQTVLQDLKAIPVHDRQELEKCPGVRYLVKTTSEAALLDGFTELDGVFDLMYSPQKTGLILETERQKIPVRDGLDLLAAQARVSAELFLDRAIPQSREEEVLHTLRERLQRDRHK